MIAISYRREDTAPITGRIYDRLQAIFGRDQVFMDLDSIPFGVDFRTHIAESLSRCHALLVVIGPHWLGVSPDGSRRIDDPSDFVRLEVAQALARNIRVIPLLIDRTDMPSSSSLPEDLKSLAFRNALRVDSGADFHHHIDRLCKSLQSTLGSSTSTASCSPQPVTSTSSPPRLDSGALLKIFLKILLRLALCILIVVIFYSLGVHVGAWLFQAIGTPPIVGRGLIWLFGSWFIYFLWRRTR
jgi:TIR domain